MNSWRYLQLESLVELCGPAVVLRFRGELSLLVGQKGADHGDLDKRTKHPGGLPLHVVHRNDWWDRFEPRDRKLTTRKQTRKRTLTSSPLDWWINYYSWTKVTTRQEQIRITMVFSICRSVQLFTSIQFFSWTFQITQINFSRCYWACSLSKLKFSCFLSFFYVLLLTLELHSVAIATSTRKLPK